MNRLTDFVKVERVNLWRRASSFTIPINTNAQVRGGQIISFEPSNRDYAIDWYNAFVEVDYTFGQKAAIGMRMNAERVALAPGGFNLIKNLTVQTGSKHCSWKLFCRSSKKIIRKSHGS